MMPASRTEDILRSLNQLTEPVRVHGATMAARAAMISTLLFDGLANAHHCWVVVCPDDEAASELISDIETLMAALFGQDVSQVELLHLPSWDQSPYSPVTPSIKTRLDRIACLSRMAELSRTPLKKSFLIATTLEASSRATIPTETLLNATLSLKVGASVGTRETLIDQLLQAGYMRVDPVEDPGTFAVRGDIIDVFAPGAKKPIRVELFGDEIEKLREFDPSTQRTLQASGTQGGSLKEFTFSPAREVLINRTTTPLLRERLKARADDLNIHRSVRDPVIASFYDGIYPTQSDNWAPYAYESAPSFWGLAPPTCKVIFSDELSVQQSWDAFIEKQKELYQEALNSELIPASVDSLFLWNTQVEKSVRERTRLYLDQLELTQVEALHEDSSQPPQDGNSKEITSTRHRLVIKNNSDLMGGARHALGDLESKFQLWLKQGFRILVVASTQSQLERIQFLLQDRRLPCVSSGIPTPKQITLCLGTLSGGFRWSSEGLVILTESEVLGTKHVSQRKKAAQKSSNSAAKDWSGLQALADLSTGDHVVHIDHGIGKYQGLVRLDLSGAPSDFLLLEYANKDKLYLPVYRLNVIQKYVGAGEGVALDRLGSLQFAREKEKVRDAVKKLAIDLVKLYAERTIRPGLRFSPRDALYREFEAKFQFDETADQLKAIDDTLADMEAGKVMDRLVCGDVGYGKTEVAIRAAFRAVTDGKQVAVLVPTTVLAHQHEQSFKVRLKDYPILVESVSRFKSSKAQKDILAAASAGKVDILIGTHRLLSKDVKFSDLGLIIVDEEHRFGVEHKERLKTMKVNTHVLTLTATPIPRTLHMALSGLRDISLINTPPVDRLPIRTYISKFDEHLIKQAIELELNRGGQVFFVHNRVQSIYEIANSIKKIVPHANVVVGHGQMAEGELEQAMLAFYQKKANILVCTSIIESGLDVPSANTIIVNRADHFGLAQLYQIRGRVGRGQNRAYAYLLLPQEGFITEDAKKRLEIIQRFVELGSGFSIANHDLELRGGGDLLGPQQSGHIAAVGFDLYTELLEEAIRELEGKPISSESSFKEPEIKAPFPAFLAEEYIPDVHQRLSLYRRFSASNQEAELTSLEEELRDRFGPLPLEAQNLLWLIRVKQLLKKIGIETLTVGAEKISLVPGAGSKLDPVRAIALVAGQPSFYQLLPDSKFVAKMDCSSLKDLCFGLEKLFEKLTPRT